MASEEPGLDPEESESMSATPGRNLLRGRENEVSRKLRSRTLFKFEIRSLGWR